MIFFVLECLDIAMYTTFKEDQVFFFCFFFKWLKTVNMSYHSVSALGCQRFCTWIYASMTGHSGSFKVEPGNTFFRLLFVFSTVFCLTITLLSHSCLHVNL